MVGSRVEKRQARRDAREGRKESDRARSRSHAPAHGGPRERPARRGDRRARELRPRRRGRDRGDRARPEAALQAVRQGHQHRPRRVQGASAGLQGGPRRPTARGARGGHVAGDHGDRREGVARLPERRGPEREPRESHARLAIEAATRRRRPISESRRRGVPSFTQGRSRGRRRPKGRARTTRIPARRRAHGPTRETPGVRETRRAARGGGRVFERAGGIRRDGLRQNDATAAVCPRTRAGERRRVGDGHPVHATAAHLRDIRRRASGAGEGRGARRVRRVSDPVGSSAVRGDPAIILHHRRAPPQARRGTHAGQRVARVRGRDSRARHERGLPPRGAQGPAAASTGFENRADVGDAGRGTLRGVLRRRARRAHSGVHLQCANAVPGGCVGGVRDAVGRVAA